MFSSGAEKASWKLRDVPGDVDGYAMVKKALAVGGPNAEMEFAASLMRDGATGAEHRRRAVAGAPAGSTAREEPTRSLTTSIPSRGPARAQAACFAS